MSGTDGEILIVRIGWNSILHLPQRFLCYITYSTSLDGFCVTFYCARENGMNRWVVLLFRGMFSTLTHFNHESAGLKNLDKKTTKHEWHSSWYSCCFSPESCSRRKQPDHAWAVEQSGEKCSEEACVGIRCENWELSRCRIIFGTVCISDSWGSRRDCWDPMWIGALPEACREITSCNLLFSRLGRTTEEFTAEPPEIHVKSIWATETDFCQSNIVWTQLWTTLESLGWNQPCDLIRTPEVSESTVFAVEARTRLKLKDALLFKVLSMYCTKKLESGQQV